MSRYPDLSPYTYLHERSPEPVTQDLVNVGWLGAGTDFPRGECPDAVVRRLIALAVSPENLTRGYHYCEFCAEKSPIRVESHEGAPAWLGNGEIHVRASDGSTFAAPTLIVHYIQAHGYLPPRVFRDAVLALTA